MPELKQLHAILDTMDGFPSARRSDFGWVMRNVTINWGAHPQSMDAALLAAKLHRIERRIQSNLTARQGW